MSHPMHCPVCGEDFTIQLRWENVDSCGEANTNINITATCPTCGFIVISEFNYDQNYSNRLMREANQDTHTEVAVPVTNYVSRWFTNKEAERFMESDEE